MDLDVFRSVLEDSGVDVWAFIDTAISVASLDYGDELKHRRDGIVERLYASATPRCWNCAVDGDRPNGHEMKASAEKESSHEGKGGGGGGSPSTPQSMDGDDDPDRRFGGLFDDEQMKILDIKDHLEDPNQSEESLVELLQSLADMDITFKALKETDIGRHVNRLRKHSSGDLRRLVKQLVRKWKDLVDEWVRLNTPGGELASSALIADGDSPQQKVPQNVRNQLPDFAFSPNPHNGSSGSDKNNAEHEPKGKAIPRREAPAKPAQSIPVSASVPPNKPREQKEPVIDSERLASARRRLQENYKEAENAKRQRTIQVMDIHDIPKPKNAYFPKNKGGSQGRHW
ncbi:hypothetical protein L1049_001952 [Liquidambar formosana]|uniref:TFIIS N-terminal domain-containing protein n=1 Tax=Liquidambar formosana TaxID=63359 RepID=A0AAP0R705_LIQFO